MKKIKFNLRKEESEQIAVFDWISWQEKSKPEYRAIYHVSNGAGRVSIQTRIILKLMGLRAGVPDICVPIPRQGYSGMYIEMKVAPNKTTPDQRRFMEILHGLGHKVAIAWSAQDAIDLIKDYVGD